MPNQRKRRPKPKQTQPQDASPNYGFGGDDRLGAIFHTLLASFESGSSAGGVPGAPSDQLLEAMLSSLDFAEQNLGKKKVETRTAKLTCAQCGREEEDDGKSTLQACSTCRFVLTLPKLLTPR